MLLKYSGKRDREHVIARFGVTVRSRVVHRNTRPILVVLGVREFDVVSRVDELILEGDIRDAVFVRRLDADHDLLARNGLGGNVVDLPQVRRERRRQDAVRFAWGRPFATASRFDQTQVDECVRTSVERCIRKLNRDDVDAVDEKATGARQAVLLKVETLESRVGGVVERHLHGRHVITRYVRSVDPRVESVVELNGEGQSDRQRMPLRC